MPCIACARLWYLLMYVSNKGRFTARPVVLVLDLVLAVVFAAVGSRQWQRPMQLPHPAPGYITVWKGG